MSPRLNEHEQLLHDMMRRWPGAVRDGAVDSDRYEAARPRILWILREVNGGSGDQREEGWDLRALLRDPDALMRANKRWASTYGAVAKVSHGLIHGLPADGVWIEARAITFVGVLREIAVINLSKIGGDSRVDWAAFGGRLPAFAEIVDRQVELLDPEVIIAGGTGRDLPARTKARRVVEAYHPQQSRIKHREYYRRILAQLEQA